MQIGVEAVDRDNAYPVFFDRRAHRAGEFTGRQFRRIDLPDFQLPVVDERLHVHAKRPRAGKQR